MKEKRKLIKKDNNIISEGINGYEERRESE
jgi:hypothetical protein